MQLLERAPRDGAGRPEVAAEDRRADEGARAIRCAACGQAITTAAQRTSLAGAHEHTRFNPGGYVYRFGCFRDAPGCAVAGEPTAEATWFAGYRWRYALCRACGVHLGWRFEGPGGFFGLVLERLVEDDGG